MHVHVHHVDMLLYMVFSLYMHLSTFHRFGAAIAAIVCTAFVVVLVVAIAVSLVIRQRAGRLAALILWVETLALQIKHQPRRQTPGTSQGAKVGFEKA